MSVLRKKCYLWQICTFRFTTSERSRWIRQQHLNHHLAYTGVCALTDCTLCCALMPAVVLAAQQQLEDMLELTPENVEAVLDEVRC